LITACTSAAGTPKAAAVGVDVVIVLAGVAGAESAGVDQRPLPG